MPKSKDVRERKCGCLYFAYGPPVLCVKHREKEQALEESTLRTLVREQAEARGHTLIAWSEYESLRGKWTSHCEKCGLVVICYDAPPPLGDQVAGWALTRDCR